MLAVAGFLCLAAAVGVHQWNLRRGVYRRVPVDVLTLVAVSALVGWFSLDGGALVARALFGIEALALLACVLYLTFGSHFPRGELSVSVGDRLPDFQLPDSEGERFDARSLYGKSAALYLFYRGDW